MRRLCAILRFVPVLGCAAVLSGCGSTNIFSSDAGWFSRPLDFGKPDWTLLTGNQPERDKNKAVEAEDLVNANGTCAPASEPAAGTSKAQNSAPSASQAQAAAPSATAAAPLPDRLEPAQGFGASPSAGGMVVGGVGLGMTECQVVRRAGQPQTVTISADAGGQRTAVLTYLSGNWPGIYHFAAGRLKEINQTPQPVGKPPKAKKKKPAKRKTAGTAQRTYVQ